MAKKLQFAGSLQGPPGSDGKSAYDYAKDGGYTGTEEEFAEKLATEYPTDVQIDGTSIADEEGVANIPVMGINRYGVAKIDLTYGIRIMSNGSIATLNASNSELLSRSSAYKTISPNNLDYAVKSAMCDGKGESWTEEEQLAARERIGSASSVDVQSAKSVADNALSIAKGRATAYIFETAAELDEKLSNEDFVSNLVKGDNFYIKALDEPDYWWDGTQKQQLETEKPDFTNLDNAVKSALTNNESESWTTEEQNAAQERIGVKDKIKAINILLNGLTTTKQQPEYLSELADLGMFGEVYNVGDQFVTTWADTAASKAYEYPFRLNHIGNAELEDGTVLTNRPYLQAHYAHPFGVQFSHQRAFLRCPDGLSAGTYYFTIEKSWGTNVSAGDVVCFTLTTDVPAGGRLSGCYGAPDQDKSNWRIYSHSADGKTKLETVTPTFEANGTDLGIQKYNTRNGNLNSTQEMAYGWNRWSTSALRQYLNSDAGVGEWWIAQDEWDIAPDQLTQKAGFLTGLPTDLLSVLKTVKVTTYANTANDGGVADVTYDKVFIPSLEQIFVVPQIVGEGEYHEYWKKRSGSETPIAQYTTNPNMITYAVENHTSPQYVRLRSANRGHANSTWHVYSSGTVSSYYASNAHRFSPLGVI